MIFLDPIRSLRGGQASSFPSPRGGTSAAVPIRVGAPNPGVVAAVLALLLSFALVIVQAGPALAQDPFDCDIAVVDTSGEVDVARVEQAWSGIDRARIGVDADVLVRVWDVVPGADLAGSVDEVVATCVGDPDLGIAADAIVLGLSVRDGQSDVLVGGAWTAAVPDADVLRTQVMGPPLSDGDLTGGLVAALDFIAGGVADLPAVDDSPATDGQAGADDQTEAGELDSDVVTDGEETVDEQAGLGSEPAPEPTVSSDDGGSGVAVALGALGLAGCGGAAFLVARRRALAERRNRLRRSVEPAYGRLRVLRERHQRLLDQSDIWYQTSAGRTRTGVIEGRRAMESAGQGTDQAASMLLRAIPDGVDGASKDQAIDGQNRVAALLEALDVHAAAIDELSALGAHLDHLEVALPVKAEMLAHELPEVRTLANKRLDEGWAVDEFRERLTAIQTTIGEVEEADGQLEVDLLDLSDRLEQAEATLFSVDHELHYLPDRPGSLERWNERLDEAAEQELARADELRRQLATAALHHAAESWSWAADHPDGAIEALERADDHQEAAIEELVPAQRFDDAGQALDTAGLELMMADDLLDQLDDLLVDLEQARVDAPRIVDELDHSLEVLGATLARYHQDLSPGLLERRGELERVVAGLRTELARTKPNHLRVVETGEDTDRAIDEVLVLADEEHQRAEAMRRELQRQRSRAERALARARRALGWQLFPSADGAALDRLEADLATVPNDLATAIEHTSEVADAALRLQEQIIARRRRRNAGVTIGSGPPILGGGWRSSGSNRRSGSGRSRVRSSGSRSFGGRRRSSGGRSVGSRRSTG
ncbi:MAG: hypothetical protein AAFO29_04280, partial [Actinomycetota bacterium]